MKEDVKSNPRERLVESAMELIYREGFDSVTVNHLIDASQTHKASFYRYFQNKEEVGELYLVKQGTKYSEAWKTIMDQCKTTEEFVNTWIIILLKQIREKKYFGCPIAKFMASSEKSSKSSQLAKQIIQDWTLLLSEFFISMDNRKNGDTKDYQSDKEAYYNEKAKMFIKIFQGNSQLFVITGEISYIKEMKTEMQKLISNF
ncbi:MAG: TetR/AcrR family transcriptional regulator [Leptospiraceae bacterium]|nr:TetR/AcrR family transcriptional regulator [Leptospiraceae bacterium]